MPDTPAGRDHGAGRIHGFAPLARPDARLLLLGSMPSVESLSQHRYYAHPRNAFWPILSDLLGMDSDSYEGRVREVTAHGIAVWDVLRDCTRPGSLDSAIEEKTAVTNDFNAFFRNHGEIRYVFFNGGKAEALYRKRVLPALEAEFAALPRVRLPSTSPAHAGMNFEQKREAWKAILDAGVRMTR